MPRSRLKGRIEDGQEVPNPEAPKKVMRTAVEAAKTNRFKIGDKVNVDWNGQYYPSEITHNRWTRALPYSLSRLRTRMGRERRARAHPRSIAQELVESFMSARPEVPPDVDAGPRLIDILSIRALPQSTDPWQLAVRDTPPRCDPARLYRLMVLVSPGANTIRQMLPLSEDFGVEGEIVSALECGMLRPRDDQSPARPPAIWVDDAQLAQRIALPMESCGVEVLVKDTLPAIEPVLVGLSQQANLFSHGPLLGTAVEEQALAEAAARVARAEPWRYFLNELPLQVRELEDPASPRSIVVVLGQLRELEGVASYNHEDAYMQVSSLQCEIEDAERELFVNSLTFERASEVPKQARAAFKRRNLPVEHGLYPCFLHFDLGGRPDVLRRPQDALRLARDLNVVAALIEQHADTVVSGRLQTLQFTCDDRLVEVVARHDLSIPDAKTEPPIDEHAHAQELRVPHLLSEPHSLLVTDLPTSVIAGRLPADRMEHLLAGEHPETVRGLLVRGTEALVRRACEDMQCVEGLGFGRFLELDGRHHEVVLGYAQGEPLFMLASVPESDDQPRLCEAVAGEGVEALLLVAFVVGDAGSAIEVVDSDAIVGAFALPHRRLPQVE